jgi:butyrate kinase
MKPLRLLAINPGSTSTKIALFEDDTLLLEHNVSHDAAVLKTYRSVQDQLEYRKQTIEEALRNAAVDLNSIDIFVGRGGGLVNVSGGTYLVTARLLEDARKGMAGQHPAQLGSQICDLFAQKYDKLAYIVNPPDVDEYETIARVSGLSGLYRQSHLHALNHKEIALRYCAENNLAYDETNLIVCHIGGGVSIAAHRRGRMVDGNDILCGEGPMTPTRAGSLATIDVMKLCFSGNHTEAELKDRLTKNGGLIDHLGTADVREVQQRIAAGDTYAQLVFDAMLYQIAKYAGAMAVVLKGEVAACLLTGGITHDVSVVDYLSDALGWIAPVVALPGEFEMEALAAGALRVARGNEEALIYTGDPIWSGFKS